MREESAGVTVEGIAWELGRHVSKDRDVVEGDCSLEHFTHVLDVLLHGRIGA